MVFLYVNIPPAEKNLQKKLDKEQQKMKNLIFNFNVKSAREGVPSLS